MTHTIRLRTPAQLAAQLRQSQIKRDRIDRCKAERAEFARRAVEASERCNAEAVLRGDRPVQVNTEKKERPKFVDCWVAPVKEIIYAPVLQDSRLIDMTSIAEMEPNPAVAAVLVQYASHFFCRRMTENTDFSVSPLGVHMRCDLWPEMQRRLDVQRVADAARMARLSYVKKAALHAPSVCKASTSPSAP